LIKLSIARARLASTAFSRVTSKLIFSARPSFTLPSPSRSASSIRVSCSVVRATADRLAAAALGDGVEQRPAPRPAGR
jgi:hypothetical protein